MPSPDKQHFGLQGSEAREHVPGEERSSTPPRPSFSPVTPTITQASLANVGQDSRPPLDWIDEPEPLPISLEDNSDAIALRAAISILQLQREQSLRDIRALDTMKAAALREPESFAENLKAGKLSKSPPSGITNLDDSDDEMTDGPIENDQRASETSKFGKFPNAQNVVRCPPINWDKYHVVGESLDKLHEQQRRRPSSGDFLSGDGDQQHEHVIAAPYRPFVDKLNASTTPPQSGGAI